MRHRLRLLCLAPVILLIAAGAYTAFWYQAAGRVQDGLAAWTSARRAEGYSVAYEGPEISGYPWHLRIRLERVALAAPGARWRWSGDAVQAKLMPWAFRRITLRPLGTQSMTYPGADGGETATTVAADAKAVILVNDRGRLEEAHATAEGLSLALPRAPGPIAAGKAQLDLALPAPSPQPAPGGGTPAPSAMMSLRLEEVTLPQRAAGALGPRVQWLSVDAALAGAVPEESPAKALAAWRDGGGALELKRLDLAWGPLALAGDATLALDRNMQPEGAGTARIRGYGETIDALMAQGLMKPKAGTLAKAALGLLAKTPADGGAKVLTVPLTIENQVLYAGPVVLLKLPTIVWAE